MSQPLVLPLSAYDLTGTVWVTTSFVGLHKWPDAPLEQAYLKHAHRHRFEVKVEVDVSHGDREVEYHWLLGKVESLLASAGVDNSTMSCETMAQGLLGYLIESGVPGRHLYRVTISEDGENGSTVEARLR